MIRYQSGFSPQTSQNPYTDPISRIEAERKMSPMAQIVARTTQQPAFYA